MVLKEYKRKRKFHITPEPKPKITKGKRALFVVQKHHARRLHYDFRIAVKGVLKSWAVPKGIPKKAKEKRLAIQTEDHPLAYAKFEGTIPKGEYGAGKVILWDKGNYCNLKRDDKGKEISLSTCLKKGQIEIYLEGKRYKGAYALIHFKEKNWLIMKMKTSTARYLLQKKGKKSVSKRG